MRSSDSWYTRGGAVSFRSSEQHNTGRSGQSESDKPISKTVQLEDNQKGQQKIWSELLGGRQGVWRGREKERKRERERKREGYTWFMLQPWRAAYCCVKSDIRHLLCYIFLCLFFLSADPRAARVRGGTWETEQAHYTICADLNKH